MPGRWGTVAIITACIMGGAAGGLFGLQSLVVMIPVGMLLGYLGTKMDSARR